jgi:hypothetical protein
MSLILITIKVYKTFFYPETKISKCESHGFIYRRASRMLLDIKCDCPCYSIEKSTDGCGYAHCVMLVMPRNIIYCGIKDIHGEFLQVVFYGLLIGISYSYYDTFLPCLWIGDEPGGR